MSKVRHAVAALVLSASAFVGLLTAEGYRSEAYIPIKGDVPTIGFGTTEGVQLGELCWWCGVGGVGFDVD